MGSEDRAASPMHRRCGSMCSPICVTSTSPMHRQRRRCIAGASPMHRRCIADVSAIRRDHPTPSTPTPSKRPLPGAFDGPRG
eukprot:7929946-Pyramimonas_sp.AAC.1